MHAGVRPGLAGAPDRRGRHRPRPADRAEPHRAARRHASSCTRSCARAPKPLSCLPTSRVLRAMPPLQPLGQERHRRPVAAPTRPPQPRHAGWKSALRTWRAIHSRAAEAHCHAPGRFLHSPAGDARAVRRSWRRREANGNPLHQRVRDRRRHRSVRGCGRSLDEIAALGGDDGRGAAAYHGRAAARQSPGPTSRRRGDDGSLDCPDAPGDRRLGAAAARRCGLDCRLRPVGFRHRRGRRRAADLPRLVDRRQLSRQRPARPCATC